MKKYFASLAGMVLLAVTLCGSALAQTDVRNRVKSDIPNDFQVGETMLPAGVYTFIVDPVEHRVQIIQDSTMDSIFVTGRPANWSQNGQYDLTFADVAGTYHLVGIDGQSFGIHFRPQNNAVNELAQGRLERVNQGTLQEGLQ